MKTIEDQIIGIDVDTLEIFSGYDNVEREFTASNKQPEEDWLQFEHVTKEEKIALADKMIAIWARYKEAAE